MVAACEYFGYAFALELCYLGPEGHAAFIAEAQLTIDVVAAGVDIAAGGEAEGVVGSSGHHGYCFA